MLAGATDADNDYLSTELAEPNDWWFHADSVPGSHVILRAKPDAEPSRETLRQAAALIECLRRCGLEPRARELM